MQWRRVLVIATACISRRRKYFLALNVYRQCLLFLLVEVVSRLSGTEKYKDVVLGTVVLWICNRNKSSAFTVVGLNIDASIGRNPL
jgi:hypothetical protein